MTTEGLDHPKDALDKLYGILLSGQPVPWAALVEDIIYPSWTVWLSTEDFDRLAEIVYGRLPNALRLFVDQHKAQADIDWTMLGNPVDLQEWLLHEAIRYGYNG